MTTHTQKHHSGFSSVEVVIGTSLLAVVVLFSTAAVVRFVTEGARHVERTQALYLAEEALEVARFLHDEDWANITSLSNDTPYYIDFSQNPVVLTSTPSLIDGKFLQEVTFSAVDRDGNEDIAASGTNDPDTRLVTAAVGGSGMATVTLQAYLADINTP